MTDRSSSQSSRVGMHASPLPERSRTARVAGEAAAIGVGGFFALFPVPRLRGALAKRTARWLRLDSRRVLLGSGTVPSLAAPLVLFAEVQAGAWLRTGAVHTPTLEQIRGIDPWMLVPDLLLGWVSLGLAAALVSFVATFATQLDSSSDPEFDALVRRAADRYLGANMTAWQFARSKLRLDPVFEEVLRRALPRSGGTLIDVGCGQGVMLALVAEGMSAADDPAAGAEGSQAPRFERLVGIETRPRVARMAGSALGERASILHGDARRVKFESCSAVLLFDVLQMMEPAQQEALLAELRGVLEPGGVILVREADASAGWRFQRVRIGNRLKVLAGGALRQEFSFRSREAWLDCFRRLGFDAEVRSLRGESASGNVLFRLTANGTATSARAALYSRS